MAEEITLLLSEARAGDKDAESRLMAVVYGELHRMAARYLSRERPGHTLQATALVHEAYMRLFAESETDFHSRAHFFGMAAQVMRHILVDYARQHLAGKRGSGKMPLSLENALVVADDRLEQLLILEDALLRLERHDPRVNQVVVMRFYGGLTLDEIADVLQISARTVKRDWKYGQTWLKAELDSSSEHEPVRSHPG